jgi:hypothetical protein
MSEPNNGTSIISPRPSRTTTGNLTHSISNPMETQATSDVPLLTQDGGNSSDTEEHSLSVREVKFFTSMETVMRKTETLKSRIRMENSTNNGTLCTLINGRVNQPRDNSIETLDSTLKETSTLFQK